jgi:hypothetical protein
MSGNHKTIYIETTIPSYATAKPSGDAVVAGRQAITKFFWKYERYKYDLVISQDVVAECSRGDPEAATRRLEFIAGIVQLKRPAGLDALANHYQKVLEIPNDAKTDCVHLAYCVIEKIDYLLSWNCRHLGLVSYAKTKDDNDRKGLWTPRLVTPEFFTNL